MITVREVPLEQWHQAVAAARTDGHCWFDSLDAFDDIGRRELIMVTVRLVRPGRPDEVVLLRTGVPRDATVALPSIGDLFAGALWCEREVAELFGIEVTAPDRRRLLLPEGVQAPLRKDHVLAARTVSSWPGAKEPGESEAAPSRRRMVPPGVPDPQVWGDRTDAGAPDPAEVAASVAGGRVRRRR
ncbi:NADH-quinone oxidoreductase subunit C [Propionibacteriaceae bacterium Y1700]|uniref:NADH-quinone oxidoreductase subunit C n=1 Tax=Microlunatus sp. Y1700 TaxID=3418487 RepID=UPI003DA77B61